MNPIKKLSFKIKKNNFHIKGSIVLSKWRQHGRILLKSVRVILNHLYLKVFDCCLGVYHMKFQCCGDKWLDAIKITQPSLLLYQFLTQKLTPSECFTVWYYQHVWDIITVIANERGIGVTSSNSCLAYCFHFCTHARRKGMNLSFPCSSVVNVCR